MDTWWSEDIFALTPMASLPSRLGITFGETASVNEVLEDGSRVKLTLIGALGLVLT